MNNLFIPQSSATALAAVPPRSPATQSSSLRFVILKICFLPDYKEVLSFFTIRNLQVELVKIERKGEL